MRADEALLNELAALLDGENVSEQIVQSYLERHPEILVANHTPNPRCVISQFPLGPDFRCDFAFYTYPSFGMMLHLTEIESPRLEPFTGGDEFSSQFNHAFQQLEDWSGWVKQNRDAIYHLVQPLVTAGYGPQAPHFDDVFLDLVIGRRRHLSNARRKRRWTERVARLPRLTSVRTWDGFIESRRDRRFSERYPCLRYHEQAFFPIERNDP